MKAQRKATVAQCQQWNNDLSNFKKWVESLGLKGTTQYTVPMGTRMLRFSHCGHNLMLQYSDWVTYSETEGFTTYNDVAFQLLFDLI